MRNPNAKQITKAKATLRQLFSTYQAWLRIETIRRALPQKFAKRIPRSRLGIIKAIIRKLQGMGALKVQGNLGEHEQGLGWIQVVAGAVALVAVAGAATVWAVMKYAPRVQEEFRLVKQAENATALAQRAYLREKQESKELGPDVARQYARERSEEAGHLISTVMPTSYSPPPPPGESDEESWLVKLKNAGMPSWTPMAGIIGGSAILALYIYSKRK
jgi:hypothetical protein